MEKPTLGAGGAARHRGATFPFDTFSLTGYYNG